VWPHAPTSVVLGHKSRSIKGGEGMEMDGRDFRVWQATRCAALSWPRGVESQQASRSCSLIAG